MEKSYSWEQVKRAQPTHEYVQLHDESLDHVEQLKCTDRRANSSLQT